jgi:hypothetical protein
MKLATSWLAARRDLVGDADGDERTRHPDRDTLCRRGRTSGAIVEKMLMDSSVKVDRATERRGASIRRAHQRWMVPPNSLTHAPW